MPQQQPLSWAGVFGSPAGQDILTHLRERFWVEDVMYQPALPAADLYFREGQRSVILMIQQCVDADMYHPDEVPGTYQEQPQEELNV